jgi:hypothetical protein
MAHALGRPSACPSRAARAAQTYSTLEYLEFKILKTEMFEF